MNGICDRTKKGKGRNKGKSLEGIGNTSTHHVEVEESEEEEEGVSDANGAGGPERSQHEADVVDERQLGGVHSSGGDVVRDGRGRRSRRKLAGGGGRGVNLEGNPPRQLPDETGTQQKATDFARGRKEKKFLSGPASQVVPADACLYFPLLSYILIYLRNIIYIFTNI